MLDHPQIVNKLEKRLRAKLGCVTTTCEEYHCNGIAGECDLYGIDLKNCILYAIEVGVTSPKNSTKAFNQLNKDEVYLRRLFHDFEPFSLLRFYAYSEKNKRRGYDILKF